MLLSLSRISFEKNIQAVLDAFAQVLKEEDKGVVVAGDGPYLDSLKEQAEKLNIQKHVIFYRYGLLQVRQPCTIKQLISLFQPLRVKLRA